MTFRHWTPSCQLQPATTLKVWNPSPSNWQHRYLKVSSLQKSKLQPWGTCIYYKKPQSLMKRFTGFSMRHLRVDPALGIWWVQQRIRSLGTGTNQHASAGCMHVCMCVCMYVCMYVCVYVYVCVCMYVCMYVCHNVCNVCMYVSVCMYVCVYVYVCMYHVCIKICIQCCRGLPPPYTTPPPLTATD